MAFTFTMTEEKPKALRGPQSREISEEQEEVLAAFQASIKAYGTDDPAQAVTTTCMSMDAVKELRKLVQWAAKQEEWGARFRFNETQNGALAVTFWAEPLNERLYVECPICHRNVQVTEANELRTHGPRDERCKGSGAEIKIS